MSYGIGGILGNLVTSVATPAVGGFIGDMASKEVEDELLKQITQSTVGALSGAAVGAGIGALTGGGGAGALSGALTGGVGGGLGGYNAQDVSQMFGANPPEGDTLDAYGKFIKKNFEPLLAGTFLGSSIGAADDTNQQAENTLNQFGYQNALDTRRARNFSRSIWGMAEGGPVDVGLEDPQINVHFPAWAQEHIQREGGLAAVQHGLNQGMANGGFINTQQVNPESFYPQSQIPKAQPYLAATPIRHEVLNNFAYGGLIDGPGDGMSDDIDANISGQEPVKVADGEYVIPRGIAAKYGPDALRRMMEKVRAAAHAKKGKQIVQDAAKRAFINTLGGIKA